jgi:hypothetical protein
LLRQDYSALSGLLVFRKLASRVPEGEEAVPDSWGQFRCCAIPVVWMQPTSNYRSASGLLADTRAG